MVVDVILLAAFYAYRVLLGGAAIDVTISHWLIAFSIFFFLSLAMAKRYTELLAVRDSGQQRPAGRGYAIGDLPVIAGMGAVSGYLAVLVLALYINEADTAAALYAHRAYLWLLCPALLYWITRLWLIVHRGQMHDDPVVFALRDWVSYALAAIIAAVLALATFG
jgi:4-hydroxybenzoate polyprenyltransferase